MGDEMTLWVEDEEVVRSSRGKGKSKKSTKGSRDKNVVEIDNRNTKVDKPAGVQLTERDLEVLAWIADQYAVRTDVIRWLLGNGTPLSDSRTRAVIARWQRAGVAESRRFFAGAPNFVWLTRSGTALVRPGWRTRSQPDPRAAHRRAMVVSPGSTSPGSSTASSRRTSRDRPAGVPTGAGGAPVGGVRVGTLGPAPPAARGRECIRAGHGPRPRLVGFSPPHR